MEEKQIKMSECDNNESGAVEALDTVAGSVEFIANYEGLKRSLSQIRRYCEFSGKDYSDADIRFCASSLEYFYSDTAKEEEIWNSEFDVFPYDVDHSIAHFLYLEGRVPTLAEIQTIHTDEVNGIGYLDRFKQKTG